MIFFRNETSNFTPYFVNRYENENEKALDRKVVCLSAGTAAVHLALIACGVKAGDEVLVQSYTFCASSHPITYLGAKPVFVGSEKETWNMDPVLLEEAIGYNYRMSNVCAGIGRGQMKVLDKHIAHHKHVQALYEELLADVKGVHIHKQPVYAGAPVYTNGVEEELFKVGFCLPAGPYVTDEDVRYIVDCIKNAIL